MSYYAKITNFLHLLLSVIIQYECKNNKKTSFFINMLLNTKIRIALKPYKSKQTAKPGI